MLQLIASVIFLISISGIAFILFKKAPLLVKLPQNGSVGFKKHDFVLQIEKKIKDAHFRLFEKQMLLHKILSLIKVWTLKIETRVDTLLHGIRKKAQQLDKEVKKKK
ncbi:MAG: hypothetical protein A2908_02625 [Candidatus Staskawiczbacteria bacterium RIFCSPLOWO2_01_FULL_38_12b]|uniref:Uncharacterized protein n=1 Tax=Candidatus Staskawiczbacteria bacterium RIFCSPLOWO2_01_FULL_38_12b TaxID=1802214 RepID=A0A1G2IBK3_9BACT|nr:MAG: hypothetical protein A2908_02625 [Candidatus Staskawiczbacteria bacterium RIFCSPLOWO2_01_FULL_38_12b]